ncbi:unnamed protein product [Schistosoma rodhaini]|nr:unnamed protein product [Schistosoma rodhaini]
MNTSCILGLNKYTIVKIHFNNSTSFIYHYYYLYNVYQYWIIKLFIINFMIFCNINTNGLAQPWFSLEAVKEYLDVASPAKIIHPPLDTKAIAGESVLFFCQAEGNPLPRVVFRWNNNEITQNRPGLQFKELSADSVALRAKLEPNHNGDTVTCFAQNHVGSDSATAQISVYNANETPPRGFPKVHQDPSATISQVGDSTHLQCDVSAEPQATVYWIKDQFELIDTSLPRFRIVGSGSLVIETLLETDSGAYECMARNEIGTVLSNSGHLHVRRIQFPPTINEMPDKVEVSSGKGTNLTCRAGGFPIPMVWWSTLGTPAGPRPSGPIMLSERALTEPQPHEATLRLTDITESSGYNCIAKNGLGLVRRNVSVIVKQLPAPPSSLDARPIGSTYAVLRWPPSISSGVDSYTVSLQIDDGGLGELSRRQITNIDPSEMKSENSFSLLDTKYSNENPMILYNLTGLSPFTLYSAQVHAVSRVAGLSLPSDLVKFRTAELAPGTPPQVLQAIVDSPDSVVVTWKSPVESNGRITGYKLYYTTRPEDSLNSWLIARTTQEKYHLTKLIPNATYYIKVNAFNAAGDGPVSEQLPIVVTPGVPTAPTNLRGISLKPTNIHLTWTPPEDMSSDRKLLGYKLKFRPATTSSSAVDQISDVKSPLSSASDEEEIKKQKQKSFITETRDIDATATQYLLTDLEPSTRYYLSLAGKSIHGYGVAAQIEVQTNDYPFDLPSPKNVQLRTLTNVSAKICWDQPNLPELMYSTISYEILFGLSNESISPLNATGIIPLPQSICCCFTMMHLRPGTDYRIWLRLVSHKTLPTTIINNHDDNNNGFMNKNVASWPSIDSKNKITGPVSELQAFRTLISVPMKPRKLHLVDIHKRTRLTSVLSGTEQAGVHGQVDLPYLCVELAWDPPEGLHTTKQISYQVFVRLIGPQELIEELTDTTLSSSELYGSSLEREGGHPLLQRRLLANVTGNTFRSSESDRIGYGLTYLFEVALMNTSSVGLTAQLEVTTPDAPPSSSPLHVRLSGLSSSSVEVSWAPPPVQYRNGKLTGYEVRIFEVGAETQTETIIKVTVPGQRQYTARGLKEKTFYTFMVRAFTSAGPGPWSGASNIRTSIELPPPPLDIQASRINQHQIKVTWRIPTREDQSGVGSKQISIQGFRLLYSANNNPYESGQWTSFDVGPVNMAIISHLESKTSYVICIKSRGPDGRYGDCSQPVISRLASGNGESDFSVRGLFCSGDDTSVKVTWQQPKRTEKLEGFKLRIGGSKKFADDAGVIKRLEFPARSVSVTYAALHSGYTYTVSDLEPNSVYDVQLSAYYDLTLNMQSNWETTSCFTQMQRPPFVPTPIPVAVSPSRLQVLLQLSRVSEQYGKIRQYFLVVAPVHLADSSTEKISIDTTITASRGLPSSETRYVAARYLQDYFDPPPRHSRNFTLGSYNVKSNRPQRHVNSSRIPRQTMTTDDEFLYEQDSEIMFDNKALVLGQEYKSFVRACVFQEDQSTSDGPEACTSSAWSHGFGPDRHLPPWSEMMNKHLRDSEFRNKNNLDTSDNRNSNSLGFSLTRGLTGSNRDLFIIGLVAVIISLALIAVICIAFGCFIRRKRRPKLINHLTPNDSTMKQPLMRMNDCGPANGNSFPLMTSGIEVINTNFTSSVDKRGSSVVGNDSLKSGTLIAASSPGPPQSSLISSISATGRPNLITSATPSPLTGIAQLDPRHHVTQAPSPIIDMSVHHGYSLGLTNLNSPPAIQQPMNPFISHRGGTSSSHTGSHPSSLTGSGTGAAYNVMGINNNCVSENNAATMYDGLIIARNGLPGSESGPESAFDMPHLPFEIKGHSMHHPIPVNLLPDHVARLSAADNLLFSQEYESIETEQQFTWENSNLDMNKPKNRYANVIAYDHSRVVLQSIDCVPGSDYINANYIDGYRRMNAYIATQGPTPETFSDFWRMIWEQRVSIIVMMTRLEERSRVKCDQYWPSRGPESFASGLLLVKPVDTIELAYYTIRTFHLTARGIEDECREVKHFQFTGWPDHGVPEYPIPLLLFIRRVRATLTPNTNNMFQSNHNVEQAPIVVHCSAGVGRTGAFIVIDIMLERLKYEKTVDIYGCVKALRKQRNFMVQTEDQYIFIHSALLEVIDAGNTEVPARNLSAHIKKLRMLDATGGSGMELEFKKLAQFRLPHAKYTSAQQGCNKNKNRLLNILPYESTRVPLQPIRGVEGSDYINANFVDSYRDRKAYIATQAPMAKTVEDFWRMIWELNSNIVVMLTNLNERGRECCYPYWPTERSSRYQYYVVDPMVEYNMPNYTLREFKLTDARDGQARTLRQFQFTDWPEHGVPESCEAFIDFLGQVHKTKEQFGQDGPITIHCSAGVGRTGVFLALSIVLERMRHEGIVDMFQTIRMLRTQRPGMVQTEDQYQFCYNAVLEYLSSFDHYSV